MKAWFTRLANATSRVASYGAVVIALVGVVAFAQEQPSLDELLDLEKPAAPRESAPAPTPDDAALCRLAGDEQAGGNPLGEAIVQMRDVTSRLSREQDAGLTTQRVMESILDKLDQVIAQAEQQSQQSSQQSSSQQQGQASNQDSQAQQVAQQNAGQQPGPPGEAQPGATADPRDGGPTRGTPIQQELDHRPMEALRREWGNLPPRLRDELREGLDERFSPVYQRLTEEYYRRLAEEE